MNYTITLTEAEDLALQYVAADPQDWIDNAALQTVPVSLLMKSATCMLRLN
jgi:hypothetical protein